MKKVVFSLVLLSAVLLSAVSPGLPSSDISFIKQFRLPAWRYITFDLGLNGSGSNFGYQVADKYRRTERYMISLDPDIIYYQESENDIISINVNLHGKMDYLDSREQYYSNSIEHRYKFSPHIDAELKKYTGDIFVKGKLDFDYNYQHVYMNKYNEINDRNVFLGFSGGFGVGKVRDVTPVVRALRFKKRYNSIGKGNLKRQEIEALARVMAKYPGYNHIYDRSGKFFWDDIFNTLGDKMNGLGGYETFMVTEAIQEEVGKRLQGSEVSVNLEYKMVDLNSWYGNKPWSYIGPEINSRTYNNISTIYQIGFEADFGYYLPLSEIEPFEHMLLCRVNMNHLFTLTDRWIFTNDLTFAGENGKYSEYTENKGYRLIFDNKFSYYLENNLSFDFYVNGTFIKYDGGDGGYYYEALYPEYYTESAFSSYDKVANWRFGINMNYRFRTM